MKAIDCTWLRLLYELHGLQKSRFKFGFPSRRGVETRDDDDLLIRPGWFAGNGKQRGQRKTLNCSAIHGTSPSIDHSSQEQVYHGRHAAGRARATRCERGARKSAWGHLQMFPAS